MVKKKDGSKVRSTPQLAKINVIIPESSSADIPSVSPIRKRTSKTKREGNLRLSNANYETLIKSINNLESLYRRRESITKSHDSIVSAINSGGSPGATRISQPRPPHGFDFSSEFLSEFQSGIKDMADSSQKWPFLQRCYFKVDKQTFNNKDVVVVCIKIPFKVKFHD